MKQCIMHMLNGTWPQICQIKNCQSPKFSNLPQTCSSKITSYIVLELIRDGCHFVDLLLAYNRHSSIRIVFSTVCSILFSGCNLQTVSHAHMKNVVTKQVSIDGFKINYFLATK